MSNKKQTFSLLHLVGKDHKKPALSSHIGHICPILKANQHSLTISLRFPRMGPTHPGEEKLSQFNI
jgi:hypothetical protein